MRIMPVLIAIAAMTSTAVAGSPCTDLVPPAKYRVAPKTPPTVLYRSATVIKMVCGTNTAFGRPPLACYVKEPDIIYIVTGRSHQDNACLLKHELAHRDGEWPADHPRN